MRSERFVLMNKNRKLLEFRFRPAAPEELRSDVSEKVCAVEVSREEEELPPGFTNIYDWLTTRRAPKHRENIETLLKEYGCQTLDGFAEITHALSLQDTYWVKQESENLSWEQVSLYRNAFEPAAARIAFEGGTYSETFKHVSPEFTTDGGYAKCWEREEGGIVLMKSGSDLMDNREPYSERYASELAALICRKSVEYDVVEYRGKLVSRCKLFTDETTGFVPAWKLLRTDDPKEILDFMGKYGAEDDSRRMMVLDALILNTDRHAGNIMARPKRNLFYEREGNEKLYLTHEWLAAYDRNCRQVVDYLVQRDVGASLYYNTIRCLEKFRLFLIENSQCYAADVEAQWFRSTGPYPKGCLSALLRLDDFFQYEPINTFPIAVSHYACLCEPWKSLLDAYLLTLDQKERSLTQVRNCIARFLYSIQSSGITKPSEITFQVLETYIKGDATNCK